MIVLSPTNRGMRLAVQLVVPVAVPAPAPSCQVTFATPTLSDAVPRTATVPAVVVNILPAGEPMLSACGVRSPGADVVTGATVRVNFTLCTAFRDESLAVTVMVLLPAASG